MGKRLPDDPKKGDTCTILVESKNGKRDVTFKATGKTGGRGNSPWKIVSNAPHKTERQKRV